MRQRILLSLAAVICGFGLLAGCGGGQQAFLSFKVPDESQSAKLGMSRDDIYSRLLLHYFPIPEKDSGVSLKWADANTHDNCTAVITIGTYIQAGAGLSLNNAMADVLPLYQKDAEVQVLTNEPAKIVLGKQLDGVHYTIAVRGYADGAIKSITVYNADLYTDNDADYQ